MSGEDAMQKYERLRLENLEMRRRWEAECKRIAENPTFATNGRDSLAKELTRIHTKFLAAAAAVGKGSEVTSPW
jgi:hypothetical protein